jgi:DNA polymerase V
VADLSSNDGCVIVQNEEMKEAGVSMRALLFKREGELSNGGRNLARSERRFCRATICYAATRVCGNTSRRVHSLVEREALELEPCSIDEAFGRCPISLGKTSADWRVGSDGESRITSELKSAWGSAQRKPSPRTKTLAKVAHENAKARKRAGRGQGTYVCPNGPEWEELLKRVPVGDIWGIGSAYEEKLHEKGVATAAEFKALPDPWIRSGMTVVGLRTAWELRGRSCLDLELLRHRGSPARKTLVRSRSFGERVETKKNLREALATHAQRAERNSARRTSWRRTSRCSSRRSDLGTRRTTRAEWPSRCRSTPPAGRRL